MTSLPNPRPRGKLPARYAAIVLPLLPVAADDVRHFRGFDADESRTDAGFRRDMAGRVGLVVDCRVSDPGRGASAGAADRGARRRSATAKITICPIRARSPCA